MHVQNVVNQKMLNMFGGALTHRSKSLGKPHYISKILGCLKSVLFLPSERVFYTTYLLGKFQQSTVPMLIPTIPFMIYKVNVGGNPC